MTFFKRKPGIVLMMLGFLFFASLGVSTLLPGGHGRAAALSMAAFFLVIAVTAVAALKNHLQSLKFKIEQLDYDNQWKSLMIDSTDEIFVVLNMYGQVVTHNAAFEKILGLERENTLGKPLRSILFPENNNEVTNLNYILLEKLRSVFLGNETELMFSTAGLPGEVKNISFKMLPVYREGELRNILVNGRVMPGDVITDNYLVSEESRFVMENDIGLLYQLSYRLTRNLGRWFSKGDLHLLQIALHEILINAVEHGNLEIDFKTKTSFMRSGQNYWDRVVRECNQDFLKNRKVYIRYGLDEEKVTYVIRDEGKGFNWKSHIEKKPESISNQVNEDYHGLGLYMVKTIFDVRFDEKGNTVTLTKYFNKKD